MDDQITSREGDDSLLLDELRAQTGDAPVRDPGAIPGLVAHLSTRTKFLRDSVGDSVELLLEHIRDRLMNRESLSEILQGPLVRNQVIETLTGHGLTADQARELLPFLQPLLPKFLEEAVPDLSEHVQGFVDFAKSKFPKTIRDAHIKTLADHPDMRDRAERYHTFNWYVLKTDVPLVLGDTMCIFETNGPRPFKPFDDAGEVRRVFLPISADRALVGTPYRARPKLDPRRLNKAVARCSYEFFVSSVELRSDSGLPSSIGKRSGILTQDELRAIGDRIGLDEPSETRSD